jgi:SAM-dependent methyltransferase
MLMVDPLQALSESGRVLRPGGRLVLAVWGAPEKNPWLSIILDAVMAHLDAPPPKLEDPGPFALGTGRLSEMIERAGLIDIEIADIEAEQDYESLEAWWDHNLDGSGPLSAVLAALPDTDQAAIRAAALSSAREFVAADGHAVFPAAVVGAKAHKAP